MNAIIKRNDYIFCAITIGLFLLVLIDQKILPTAIGFLIGYITSRILIGKSIKRLKEDGYQPKMTGSIIIYGLIFVGCGLYSMYAFLGAAIAVVIYRNIFFISASKKIREERWAFSQKKSHPLLLLL
ncbi:MAG: hypothetical protein ACRCUP_00960 [Mycoplasmatales bacterium]